MADTNESFRQNMHEKSTKELCCGNRHQPLFVAARVISPTEGDVISIECNQPMIGDRNAMRVASEIANNMFGSAECGLGIDDPILAEEASEECRKGLGFGEVLDLPGTLQALLPKSATQSGDELSTEHLSENFHW